MSCLCLEDDRGIKHRFPAGFRCFSNLLWCFFQNGTAVNLLAMLAGSQSGMGGVMKEWGRSKAYCKGLSGWNNASVPFIGAFNEKAWTQCSGFLYSNYATLSSKSKQGQRLQRLLSDFLYLEQHLVFKGFFNSPSCNFLMRLASFFSAFFSFSFFFPTVSGFYPGQRYLFLMNLNKI